jgi:hypothetical protein
MKRNKKKGYGPTHEPTNLTYITHNFNGPTHTDKNINGPIFFGLKYVPIAG